MPTITVTPGLYVAAVSGGVDSMVLLDLLRKQAGVRLVVAHFDHGIRPDSIEDRRLVEKAARQAALPFVYEAAELGAGASEAAARAARYRFLEKVRTVSGAAAIITAHHQDDLLETAIINLLRGTHYRGLSSLNSETIVRPLLAVPKADLIDYAHEQGIVWREDSTNTDEAYLRNYVRRRLMPRLGESGREQLLLNITKSAEHRQLIDHQTINLLHLQERAGTIDRLWFNTLPFNVSAEVLAAWLRAHGLGGFDKRGVMRMTARAKTQNANSRIPVYGNCYIRVTHSFLALDNHER